MPWFSVRCNVRPTLRIAQRRPVVAAAVLRSPAAAFSTSSCSVMKRKRGEACSSISPGDAAANAEADKARLIWGALQTAIGSTTMANPTTQTAHDDGEDAAPLAPPPVIELTPREQQLRTLLLAVAEYIDASEERRGEPRLVLRWAGGWVRDKLLGQASHDIDTAINAMTGFAFAQAMLQFCTDDAARAAALGLADLADPAAGLGSLHRVAANPDKSKHLETATVRILGLDVDFVNLRRETYAEATGRTPQMAFGSAAEDALRRDATVNALFYNLHTGAVEDFAGGLPDLAARRLRTPLEPLQTFTDDPLRVLRLVRFASRLQFAIDPAAARCMADARVRDALRRKISRERVGIEVEKMLRGPHPRDALARIDRLGLYTDIFAPDAPDAAAAAGEAEGTPSPQLAGWRAAYACLDYLAATRTPGSLYDVLVHTDEAAYVAWVLAAVAPWETVEQPQAAAQAAEAAAAAAAAVTADAPDKKSKKKPAQQKAPKPPPPLPVRALREGICASNKLCDIVAGAHHNRRAILALRDEYVADNGSGSDDDDAARMAARARHGMAIRAWDARGGHWRLQVLYALLCEAMEGGARGAERGAESGAESEAADDGFDPNASPLLPAWQAFVDRLAALDVLDAPHTPRLIDGTQLAAALGVRPGRWMAAALDVCMAWQLRHPGATDPAGAVDEVRQQAAALGIVGAKR